MAHEILVADGALLAVTLADVCVMPLQSDGIPTFGDRPRIVPLLDTRPL